METTQALNTTAVCSPDGLPMVVIVGDKEKAKKYIKEKTSFVEEALQYVDVKVVI